MISLTRFALAHKRLVAVSWLAVALVGIAFAGKATKAFSDQYSVPGREGYETNAAIISRSALVSVFGPRRRTSASSRIGFAVSGRNAKPLVIPGRPSGREIWATAGV